MILTEYINIAFVFFSKYAFIKITYFFNTTSFKNVKSSYYTFFNYHIYKENKKKGAIIKTTPILFNYTISLTIPHVS